jgi:hypothetical protein
LVKAWWDSYQTHEKKVGDLYLLVEAYDIDLALRGNSDRGLRTAFGRALAKMKDRVLSITDGQNTTCQLQIVQAGAIHNSAAWKLVVVESGITNGHRQVDNAQDWGTSGTSGTFPNPSTHVQAGAHARAGDRMIEKSPHSPPSPQDTGKVRTGPAIWHAHDGDICLNVIAIFGEYRGETYLQTDYGGGGVPASQVEFIDSPET